MHNLDSTQIGSPSTSAEANRPRNGSAISEEEQMEMAAELMELESEEEFESYVGDLISRGAQAVGKLIKTPTGQQLVTVLKDTAKQLLPVVGEKVAERINPALGPAGRALGTAGANALEAEDDEREWEVANVFVKIACDAASRAADAPPSADPYEVAHHAVVEAARRHAPHIVAQLGNGRRHWSERHHRGHHTGRWVRHGRTIMILGA